MLNERQTAEFVRLLTATQPDIYMFIRSLVFNGDDAADILGESNLAIWAQREQFALGTNFRAWVFQIARHRVLQWQHATSAKGQFFSTVLFDELADYAERHAESESRRLKDLRHCMKKLSPDDSALIERRVLSGQLRGEDRRGDRADDAVGLQGGLSHSGGTDAVHRKADGPALQGGLPMSGNRQELFDLIALACDNDLQPDQLARLEELLHGDKEAQQLYLGYLQTDAALRWEFGDAAEAIRRTAADIPWEAS